MVFFLSSAERRRRQKKKLRNIGLVTQAFSILLHEKRTIGYGSAPLFVKFELDIRYNIVKIMSLSSEKKEDFFLCHHHVCFKTVHQSVTIASWTQNWTGRFFCLITTVFCIVLTYVLANLYHKLNLYVFFYLICVWDKVFVFQMQTRCLSSGLEQ